MKPRVWVGHEEDRECGFVKRSGFLSLGGQRVWASVTRRPGSVGWSCVEQRVWVGHEEDRVCGFVKRRTKNVGLSRGMGFCH